MENKNNEELNDDQVWYCRTCLSLKVMNLGDFEMVPCYCGVESCGSTDIGVTTFEEWDLMYQKKYKRKYINKK